MLARQLALAGSRWLELRSDCSYRSAFTGESAKRLETNQFPGKYDRVSVIHASTCAYIFDEVETARFMSESSARRSQVCKIHVHLCMSVVDGRVKLFQSPMESIQIHHYHSWYEKTAGTSHWSRCYLLLEVRTRYSISPSRIIQERKGNCTRSYQKLLSGIIVGLRTACRVII